MPASPTTATRRRTRPTSAPPPNEKQRNVPRAFLRSATHELTHTFNQIHQEQETAADNSIMTTTPSVADVLGGPTTGAARRVPRSDQPGVQHDGSPPPQPHARSGDPAGRLAVRDLVRRQCPRHQTAPTSTRPSCPSTSPAPTDRLVPRRSRWTLTLDADQPPRTRAVRSRTTFARRPVRRHHGHRRGRHGRDRSVRSSSLCDAARADAARSPAASVARRIESSGAPTASPSSARVATRSP